MKFFVALVFAFSALPLSALAAQAPTHIPTWAFDQRFAEGKDASSSDVRRYLTYAESGFGNDKPVRDCRGSGACSSVFYFDPGFVYYSDVCPFSGSDKEVFANASENWFLHLPGYSDQAHRVQGTYVKTCKGMRITANVYALNQNNPAVAQFFAQYLRRNADNWDYLMMDDTKSTLKGQTYGPGGGFCKGAGTLNGYCDRTQEFSSDTDVQNAHGSFVSRLKHGSGMPMRLFYNGVGFGASGPEVQTLRSSSQFVGVICENCVVNNGTLRSNMYAKVLDAMTQVGQIPNASFVEQNTGKSPPGSDDQISQRLVTTAMAWLGFIDNRTVVFPNLEFNTTNLAVWPENDIYPTKPLQTMRGGNADLSVGPSVWRREFAQCYLRGTPIGPCAAVVNGSSGSVTPSQSWFSARLSHAVALNGGDALSGGSVDLKSAPVGAIAPGHAALLVR